MENKILSFEEREKEKERNLLEKTFKTEIERAVSGQMGTGLLTDIQKAIAAGIGLQSMRCNYNYAGKRRCEMNPMVFALTRDPKTLIDIDIAINVYEDALGMGEHLPYPKLDDVLRYYDIIKIYPSLAKGQESRRNKQ